MGRREFEWTLTKLAIVGVVCFIVGSVIGARVNLGSAFSQVITLRVIAICDMRNRFVDDKGLIIDRTGAYMELPPQNSPDRERSTGRITAGGSCPG
ncbi:hypothetical protein GCM10009530_17750 [Microbispora corallina]|uniref:Uncharacterized protein n=1 Tax=Microbispora corallina TaxID=83302 RepID=A0ABQ4FY40_9ACTN|nr:hypothetical protein Mco01_27340 [Microbispora corallina]